MLLHIIHTYNVKSWYVARDLCIFSGVTIWHWTNWKASFPTSNFLQSPVLLCIGLKFQWLLFTHFGMSISIVLVQLTFGQKHYVYAYLGWIYVHLCTIYMSNALRTQKGLGAPWIQVTDSCKQSCGYWEPNPRSSERVLSAFNSSAISLGTLFFYFDTSHAQVLSNGPDGSVTIISPVFI